MYRTITEQDLASVTSRETLFAFLKDKLAWAVDPEDTFTYAVQIEAELSEQPDVSQIVPFNTNDPFVILLAEFPESYKRSDLRLILRDIRRSVRERGKFGNASIEELIFVCPSNNYTNVSFVHFEEREGRQPKIEVFGWSGNRLGETRTLRDKNLPSLMMPESNLLDEPEWKTVHKKWLAAWDVEAVTSEFFKDYKRVFGVVREEVSKTQGVDETLFTLRLFNKLLFIHFLSQKREGWLTFNGRTDYLAAMLEAAQEHGENFYHDRLYWAFFSGLGIQAHKIDEPHDLDELVERRGKVPYLNGGLFEMIDRDDERGAVHIDNKAFVSIIFDLFTRYNFTVHESTPDDIEVAVDPEMLGKVFEELVTGRHDTGSYYTPRPIVSFMCREAIKGYLGGFEDLVDKRTSDNITRSEAKQLLQKLKDVTVVDPACGSGAYLLGMLHELYELIGLLELRADPLSSRDAYKRKLGIIQNNLFGVDIQQFAVDIARLRLWLSLIVEFNGPVPEPLPNLDFKIEAGDSLAVPGPKAVGTLDLFRQSHLDEYLEYKRNFGDPYFKGNKQSLKRDIELKKLEIAHEIYGRKSEKLSDNSSTVKPFDWEVEFAEVFIDRDPIIDIGGAMNLGGTLSEPSIPGGFDIVLANPPYLRHEAIKDIKPTLRKVFPEVYTGTADLYCYFYARAVQMLRPGGMLVFISPNKWFRAGYGDNLKCYIAASCRVVSITDFGDLPVFQSATTYPMIFVAQIGVESAATILTEVTSLETPYPDVLALQTQLGQELPIEAINGSDWKLTSAMDGGGLRQMERAGVPLGEYIKGQIFYGVKTGLNAAFVIDGSRRKELIKLDPRSEEVIKPLAVGRDIHKWTIEYRDTWLIFTRRGINIKNYPAIEAHLSQWRPKLEPKPRNWQNGVNKWNGRKLGTYKWYEIQDEVAYHAVLSAPKIMYQEIATYQGFAFDSHGAFVNNKVFVIPTSDLYLLGVLNSSPVWTYLQSKCSKLVGGALAMQTPYLKSVPIPVASDADRGAISALVQKCLDAAGKDCEVWEEEINDRVTALYGL